MRKLSSPIFTNKIIKLNYQKFNYQNIKGTSKNSSQLTLAPSGESWSEVL